MASQPQEICKCPPPPTVRRTTPYDFTPEVLYGTPSRISIDPIVIETPMDTVEWDCTDIAKHPPMPGLSAEFMIKFTAGPPPPPILDPKLGLFLLITSTGNLVRAKGNNLAVGCYTYDILVRFEGSSDFMKVTFKTDPQIDNLPPIPNTVDG